MYLQWRVSRPRPNLVPNPVVYFQSVLTVVLKALICSLGITSVDMLARIVALLTEELLLGSVSLSWLTVCFRSRPVSTELSAPPLLSAVNLQQSPLSAGYLNDMWRCCVHTCSSAHLKVIFAIADAANAKPRRDLAPARLNVWV